MCMGSPSTPSTPEWSGDAIYIGHQLDVAVGHISTWASVFLVLDCQFNRSLMALK